MLELYVDGSCSGNPGPGGWGAAVIEYWDAPENGEIIHVHSENCSQTTNNREEMKAIIWALENYGNPERRKGNPSLTPVVYSDSAYCVNSFTNWIYGWKTNGWTRAKGKKLENLDLIKKYDELTSKGYAINLQKVPGHAGIFYNELADMLATKRLTAEEAMQRYGG